MPLELVKPLLTLLLAAGLVVFFVLTVRSSLGNRRGGTRRLHGRARRWRQRGGLSARG